MPVTMMELRAFGQCRTVLSGHAADTIFCGEVTAGTKSYCAACCTNYYVATPPYARKPKKRGVDALEREFAAA